MKRKSLTYLLCCCLFITYAQKNNAITIGKIDSLYSKILDEERKIQIHVPENNSEENIMTLCKCCHAMKTNREADYKSPGRKSLGLSY